VLDLDLYHRALDEAASTNDDGPAITALERAVSLYGGDLLPDCYEEWILPERERLQQSFTIAVERLADGLKGQGEYGKAIEYGRRLLHHDPIREATYRRLMDLLDLNGDRAEALRVYEACRTMLRNELDVEPGPATEDVYRRIAGEVASRPVAERKPSVQTPTNLPFPPNEFIGREGEVAALHILLERGGERLVTLTGPPGIGKTRLAQRVASTLFDQFPDGVYFVPLAAISDPELVISAIAQRLGLREAPGRPPSDLGLIQEHIQHKKLLLLLDNFEQVMEAVSLVASLVSSARLVSLLVTSREPLRLYGEHEFPVPPLELPDLKRLSGIEQLGSYSAVRLFVERASAAQSGFKLTGNNAQVVAEICQRLEGIPLAIELAATRIRLMTPQTLVSRLDKRLQVLKSDAKDLPRRLQTLRDSITWSYELLDPAETALFERLGVFVGGWTPEAAEAVAKRTGPREGDEVPVLDLLDSLVSKNLVTVTEAGTGGSRFSMLETIREFALEVLADHGESEAAGRRHALYFLEWAEEAEPKLHGPDVIMWMEQLDREHDNLRAALSWAFERGEADVALRMAFAVARFRERRGYWSEGRRSLEMALELAGPLRRSAVGGLALLRLARIVMQQGEHLLAEDHLRESLANFEGLGDKFTMARVLNSLGQLYERQGKHDEALAHHQESLRLSRETGDELLIASVLNEMAVMSSQMGDQATARRYFEEGLVLLRQVGDRQGVATALNNLGVISNRQGDLVAARSYYEMGLEEFREIGNKGDIALGLRNLSDVVCEQGEYPRAAELCRESLVVSGELGSGELVAQCILSFARIAAEQGEWLRAARLFGAGQAQLESIGAMPYGPDLERIEHGVQLVRAQLDDAAWNAAYAEGRALSVEEAVDDVLFA
jgi:predicted ATPase